MALLPFLCAIVIVCTVVANVNSEVQQYNQDGVGEINDDTIQPRTQLKRARNPYSWMLSKEEKRARNPYSWMAQQKEKRSFRYADDSFPQPRNPYSWMYTMFDKRARNPYSWMNE